MIKKIITLTCIACALLVFVQCKENEKPTAKEPAEKISEKKEGLVGGWSTMENSPMIKELASYVLSEQNISSPVKEITNISSQVVSGRNFKFDMALEDGKQYMAKVYVNTQGVRQITDFKLLP